MKPVRAALQPAATAALVRLPQQVVLRVQVRLDMAHHLILAYELHKDMDVYVRLPVSPLTTNDSGSSVASVGLSPDCTTCLRGSIALCRSLPRNPCAAVNSGSGGPGNARAAFQTKRRTRGCGRCRSLQAGAGSTSSSTGVP